MTTSERRKIICSVTFHIIAITCVVWSLYVLIDRTAEEIKQGNDNGKYLLPSSVLLIMQMLALKGSSVSSHILFLNNSSHGYTKGFNQKFWMHQDENVTFCPCTENSTLCNHCNSLTALPVLPGLISHSLGNSKAQAKRWVKFKQLSTSSGP